MERLIRLLFVILFLGGCAATFSNKMDATRGAFATGDFSASEFSSTSNLDLLIRGNALFNAGQFDASDNAFETFNRRNIDLTSGSIGREATILVGGNMSASYRPYMMDALFVSYYQILDALGAGRWNDARVIINQSYARQQNMSREYKKLIAKNQEKNSENAAALDEINSQNSKWAAYSDIMNPALMYLGGIYFLSAGDWGNATTYLGRANGMMPNNSYVVTDMNMAAAKSHPTDTTWVFIETGFAPQLYEHSINLPWIMNGNLTLLSVAISEPAFTNTNVRVSGAQLIGDVDKMFATEYNEYRINEVLRTMASAASRTVLQSTMYNSDSKYAPLLGLGATIFAAATTSAEVRSWATLPEYIYVMRTDTPKSGLIELKSNGNVIANISVPTTGNHIAYVRITNATPVVHVMNLR